MTKEEKMWFNSRNQNDLKPGYCKWAKLFIDKQGNKGYACMNKDACHRWGLEIGPTCGEPWLPCKLKVPGVFEIDKEKVDTDSIVFENNSIQYTMKQEKKDDTFDFRNFWLIILMIIIVFIVFKIM